MSPRPAANLLWHISDRKTALLDRWQLDQVIEDLAAEGRPMETQASNRMQTSLFNGWPGETLLRQTTVA